MRKGLFLTILLVLLALAKPQSVYAGAFEFSISKGNATESCKIGENCTIEAEVTAKNTTGRGIYKATIYAADPSHILSFEGFGNKIMSGESQLEEVIPPEGEIKTKVVMHPPQEIGTYQAILYMDGQGCNNGSFSTDCYFYGKSGIAFTATVEDLPHPSASPSVTLTPTKSPQINEQIKIQGMSGSKEGDLPSIVTQFLSLIRSIF